MIVIFWSGWGLLVPAFGLISLLAVVWGGGAILRALQLQDPTILGAAVGLGSLVAGGLLFAFCEWHERKHADRIFNEQTGLPLEVRTSSGSFFFFPMRSWAWVYIVLAPLALVGPIVYRM